MVVIMCGCEFGSSLKFIWLIVMLQSYMHGYVVGHIVRLALQKIEASIVCAKYNIVHKMRDKKNTRRHTQNIWGQTNLHFKLSQNLKIYSSHVTDMMEPKEGQKGLFPLQLTPLGVLTNGSAR